MDAVPSGATTSPTLPSGGVVVTRSIDQLPPASVPYQRPGSVPIRPTATWWWPAASTANAGSTQVHDRVTTSVSQPPPALVA